MSTRRRGRARVAPPRTAALAASAASVGAGLAGQLVLLVSGPLVARMLGVDGRGLLAALTLWPLLVVVIGSIGVPLAVTFELSRRPDFRAAILGAMRDLGVAQAVVLTPVAAAAVLAWSHRQGDTLTAAACVSALAVPGLLGQQYALSVLQGDGRLGAFNVTRLLPSVFWAGGAVALFATGSGSLLALVLIWTAAQLVSAVVSLGVAARGSSMRGRTSPSFRGELVRFGLRGHLGAASPIQTLRLDQVALALLLPPSALGLYAVATSLSNLPAFVGESVGKVAYPLVAAASTDDAPGLVLRFVGGTTALNAIGSTVLILAMPWLVPLFFGTEFAAATPVAQVLVVGTALLATRRVLVEGLRGLGRPDVSTIAEVAVWPWLAVMGPLLAAHHGTLGLAIAIASGYGISFVVAGVLAARAMRPRPLTPALGLRTGS